LEQAHCYQSGNRSPISPAIADLVISAFATIDRCVNRFPREIKAQITRQTSGLQFLQLTFWKAAMKFLFVLNDAPYGSQRTFNGLRLAVSLARSSANQLQIFLFGDGVLAGLGQAAPLNAFYNPQEMLAQLGQRGAMIGACKTCLEQRGFGDEMLLSVVKRSTLDDLTSWTEDADKVLVF
jgi:uncharacterized protein involved in oxidation of intracellular sulfur